MKIYSERLVKTEVERICDVCEVSVMIDCGEQACAEYGELKANFGYGSMHDGKVYHLDLCESCFKIAIDTLKDHRRKMVLSNNEQELPDEKFGLDPDLSIGS